MNKLAIFVIRLILSAVFAVISIRIFYPKAGFIYIVGLGVFMLATAYLLEYWRKSKNK